MKLRLLLALLFTLALLPACAQLTAAAPNEDGEIVIVMSDYNFEPSVVRVQAGQQITIVLRNEGEKMHEFMAGRNPHVEVNFTEPFAEDFFAGLDITVEGPGMVMGLPGMEMDMGMGGDNHVDDMDMQMEATEEAHDESGMDMAMEDEHQEDGDEEGHGDHEDAPSTEFGALQRPEMDEHGGMMVMIDPTMVPADQETRITLTITEDKVGTWEFGCFQERGQHYDDGMRGTLIIEAGA